MRISAAAFALTLIALQPGWAQDPVRIGLAATFTGPAGFYGDQESFGASAAAKRINAVGGILGRTVEIVLIDDRCDPVVAVEVARRLVKEDVQAVVGHVCGSAAIAAASVYSASEVPFLALSDRPALTEQDAPGTFRLCGRYDTQAQIVAKYLTDTFGAQNIGGVFSVGAYGDDTRAAAGEVVQFKLVEAVPDIGAVGRLVSRFAAAGLDAVMVAGAAPDVAGVIAAESDARRLEIQFVFDALAAQPSFLDKAGDGGEGAIFTSTCYVPFPDEESQATVGDRISLGGIEDIGIALHVFAALEVIAGAAKAAGSLDFDKLVEAMRSTAFETAIGVLKFDGSGGRFHASTIHKIVGNDLHAV